MATEIPAAFNSHNLRRYGALIGDSVKVYYGQRLFSSGKNNWLRHVADSFEAKPKINPISIASSPGSVTFWERYYGGCAPIVRGGPPHPACEPHVTTRAVRYDFQGRKVVKITVLDGGFTAILGQQR
jgi:hypothetical protein